MIPKLEFLMMDSVYLAALVIPNSNKEQPVVFTDELGCIVGLNKIVSLS